MITVIKLILTAGAVGAVWYGWQNIGILRGTWFNDLRLFFFVVFAFAVLSLAQWLASAAEKRLGSG